MVNSYNTINPYIYMEKQSRRKEASVRFNELPSGTSERGSEVRLIGGDSYGK